VQASVVFTSVAGGNIAAACFYGVGTPMDFSRA
jgi:hypothetical protein